jgi:magnesium transporter
VSHRHRRRKRRKYQAKPGTAPGTLVTPSDAGPTRVRAIAYGRDRHEEIELGADLGPIARLRGHYPVLWVDVSGVSDVGRIRALGEMFDLHPLALEDVINGHQRVKLDRYPHYMFFVVYMAEDDEDLGTEQLNVFIGRDFVITIREEWDRSLAPVRARAARTEGRMRRTGTDYLGYAILDSVVDHYFPVLDIVSERLESLEDEVLERPSPEIVARIQGVRRELNALRRAVWPLRDVLNELMRIDNEAVVSAHTMLYLRDLQDHVLRVIDLVESYREFAASLMDLYLSSISNRMNEIMKVLTIISTIFIPLSFLAGVWGMNFEHMPELGARYGYPVAIGLMVAVALGLLVYFRRKGWLGTPRGH